MTAHSTPSRPDAPAWTPADLDRPHEKADKPRRVRSMFAAIAGSYDLNNRLHSMWQDQAWRRFAVRQAAVKPTDEVLDVACGTGDLTRLFAAAGPKRAVGLDFTREMLDVAETKRTKPSDRGITYLEGDAMNLPFEAGSFDIVSIAFGIRNVSDASRALAEFRRVLRPGGRLVVLEFDKPRVPVLSWLSDLYTRHVMPRTATLISGDRSGAYTYLPKSVETFWSREQLAAAMTSTGFAAVVSTPLSLGICVCHRGVVPGATGAAGGS